MLGKIKFIGLYIWQLPQNLLGLFLVFIYNRRNIVGGNLLREIMYKGKHVYIYESFPGGISLGEYILIDFNREYPNWNPMHQASARMSLQKSIKHEYGHTFQSKWWGPLYLPVVGLYSGVRAGLHLANDYYGSWPEKQANKYGGVE